MIILYCYIIILRVPEVSGWYDQGADERVCSLATKTRMWRLRKSLEEILPVYWLCLRIIPYTTNRLGFTDNLSQLCTEPYTVENKTV